MKTRMTAAVILVLGVVSWAGCGADPAPEFEDRPSPASAEGAEPSPSATEPEEPKKKEGKGEKQGEEEPRYPAEARHGGRSGAIAFATYFFDAVDYASNTGKIGGLATLAHPDCLPCQSGEQSVRGIYRHGGHIIGQKQAVGVVSTTRLKTSRAESWLIDLTIDTNRYRVTDKEGDRRVIPAGRSDVQLLLQWNDSWQVTDYEVLSR